MKNLKSITIAFFFLITNFANAQTWTGNTSSNWNTESNWDGNAVPDVGATAWIPNTSNHPIISDDVELRAIIVEEGAELEIQLGNTLTLTTYAALGAVENYGIINNNGTIDINGHGFGSVTNAIYNEGIIYNNSLGANVGGRIDIDNIDGRGIYIDRGGLFYNRNAINIGLNTAIDGVGIKVNEGEFYNTSTYDVGASNIAKINISNTEGNGIGTNDIFTNNGGEINIGSSGAISNFGLKVNAGTFTNKSILTDPNNPLVGTINIDDTALEGIQCVATFENYGAINIGQTTTISDNGITSGHHFNNHSTGIIKIDRTAKQGIFHYSDGQSQVTFNNDGEIHIGSIAPIGTSGIENTTIFKNNAGALINIDNTNGSGIGTTRSFSNEGDINIGTSGNIGNDGIGIAKVSNTSAFYNFYGGTIQIERTQGNGLDARGVTLNNYGTISIGENHYINGNGIRSHTETFTNFISGEIYIHRAGERGLYNERNDFINKGLIEIGENGAIGTNAIQNGVHFPSTFSNQLCGSIIHIHSDDFILDLSNTFTNNGLLIENSTGTSNIETNNGIIVDTYYQGDFNITTNNGKVLDYIGSKLWTGCNSNDWTNASNWFPKEVPTEDDVIYIEQISKPAIIDNGDIAVGRTLNIGADATLTNNGVYDGIASINIWEDGTLKGTGEYFLGGNWVNRGTFLAYVSTVTFDGEYASGISGFNETAFNNLIINKDNNALITQKNWSAVADIIVNSGDLIVLNNTTVTGSSIIIDDTGKLDNRGNVVATDLTIETAGNAKGDGDYELSGDFINNGSFTPGNNSSFEIKGDGVNEIKGSSITLFTNLIINKTSNDVLLGTDCYIFNELEMLAGNLDLNGNLLSMTGNIIGESSSSYIHGDGYIRAIVDLNAPSAINPSNLGVEITSMANMGTTVILRYHQAYTINGSSSIERYYDINPINNSGLNANVKFYYHDHELNSINEVDLIPYRFNGSTWDAVEIGTADAFENYVEAINVDAFSIWTLGKARIQLMAKVFLQGSYSGGSMNNTLSNQDLVPIIEPYTDLGYTHVNGGGETVDPSVFDITGSDAIVDWLFLELRDKNTPTSVLMTKCALLQSDGDIVDLNGIDPVAFDGLTEDDYYLAIRHRNHLGIRSSNTINLSSTIATYDFSVALNSAYYNNLITSNDAMTDLGNGVFGMFQSDINGDNNVNVVDFILARSNSTPNQNGVYHTADLNMDSNVNIVDFLIGRSNSTPNKTAHY